MEPKTPMILPKGIVVNTKDIYHEVAKYGLVPADRVWEFWRVYTTTNKKLQDPTARRLENFWWHVLGSDRRFLSGETLARLYEDISLGPTFVPLRGPPNRWEGDDVPSSVRRAMAILENEKTPAQPQSETALNETGARLRDLSSSAAKPPPPHPILKKPRGPSSSGPRPTARFVSPQPSGDEEDKDSDTASSGSTVTPALELRLPATSPPKKKVHGKRFVVATGAAKRRPVLPKKASSQISATSDNGSKVRSSSSSSKGSSTPQLLGSPTLGDLPAKAPAKSSGSPKLSAKAAGKRPISVGKTSSATKDTPGQTINTTSQQDLESVPPPRAVAKAAPSSSAEPAQNHDRLTNRPQSLLNLPSHARRSTEAIRPANGDADGSIAAQHGVDSVPMTQSRSHTGYVHHRDRASSRELEKGLFTGATASTTNVAAQGMIIDPSDSFGQLPASNYFDRYPNPSGSAAQPLSSSLHEPRLTPTKPSTSGSVPLGRTKSQLTLLLEREDEARAGKKARSKS